MASPRKNNTMLVKDSKGNLGCPKENLPCMLDAMMVNLNKSESAEKKFLKTRKRFNAAPRNTERRRKLGVVALRQRKEMDEYNHWTNVWYNAVEDHKKKHRKRMAPDKLPTCDGTGGLCQRKNKRNVKCKSVRNVKRKSKPTSKRTRKRTRKR